MKKTSIFEHQREVRCLGRKSISDRKIIRQETAQHFSEVLARPDLHLVRNL